MTKPRPAVELERPRRRLGRTLRLFVSCPVCRGEIKVVAYRAKTTRFECRDCELRFSLDPADVADALWRNARAVVANAEGDQERVMGFVLLAGAAGLLPKGASEDEFKAAVVEVLRRAAYRLMHEEAMKPGQTPESRRVRAARLDAALLQPEKRPVD
jgi:hypothetical protein